MRAEFIIAACLLLWACSSSQMELAPVTPRTLANPGPVVARVGEQDIRQAEVGPLAAAALELRQQIGLTEPPGPIPWSRQVELAVEISALAAAAESRSLAADPAVVGERQGLLTRLYLDRLMEGIELIPLDPERLRRIYEREMNSYRQTRESDLFEPDYTALATIRVGLFPDFQLRDDVEPVCPSEQARRLAGEIRAAIGDENMDIDDFCALGRRFMSGHPTVRLDVPAPLAMVESWGDERTRELYKLLRDLAPGQASQPQYTPAGATIVLRGGTRPGKGTSLDSVRDELEQLARIEIQRELLGRHLQQLKERHRSVSWPDRLWSEAGSGVGRVGRSGG
ncbi:MAG: hypothetical protein JXR96_07825 [Deltaproteobacteria bacterium]|nr:hypothetical protein [Deltaproteobacteria bacterium]